MDCNPPPSNSDPSYPRFVYWASLQTCLHTLPSLGSCASCACSLRVTYSLSSYVCVIARLFLLLTPLTHLASLRALLVVNRGSLVVFALHTF